MKNLRDVTSNILENMFFMYEETTPDQYDQTYKYCAFINNPSLKVRIIVGEKLGSLLCKNFLGTDEVNENDILDVLKEITNMIVGNYVGKYMKDFHKNIPVPCSVYLPKEYNPDSFEHDILFYECLPLCLVMED
ncbi:MAG TPA: chemotaxis protein CheX [Candidatus Cloacimonadota bacterium]|nr:chemotaxis protein CheX [Candidatus Cloacimonadota bacterium]